MEFRNFFVSLVIGFYDEMDRFAVVTVDVYARIKQFIIIDINLDTVQLDCRTTALLLFETFS